MTTTISLILSDILAKSTKCDVFVHVFGSSEKVCNCGKFYETPVEK